MKNYFKILITLVAGLLMAPLLSGQFSHRLEGSKFPWTQDPQLKDDNFRFVIIGDLTGGEKEGVFASVIEKINQLSPDFVMCVGDLIDGYTIDSVVMKNQWKSFHDRIAKLNAPFFYMPGNHDISNQMLFHEWIRQYGYDYYSFYIAKSLFIILNAYEQREGELSDKQVQYFKRVLQDHNPENPVYLFSHPPLWDLFNKKGLSELVPLFNKYKITFFCGDDHHYIKKDINGHTHYMLSNTGGGFDRENFSLGIFNHILWATSKDENLTIANILTNGIIPADIVSNSNKKQVYTLLRNDWLTIDPTYISENTRARFNSNLTAWNIGDFPLQIKGRFTKMNNLKFELDSFAFTIPPGEKVKTPVIMINSDIIDVENLPETGAEITGMFIQDGKTIENSYRKIWIIDNLKLCSPANGAIRYYNCDRPAYVEESWSWSGPEDGKFRFSTSHDSKNIYLKIITDDDILIADSLNPAQPQDKLFINFSADTTFLNRDYMIIEMMAGNKPSFKNIKNYPKNGISGVCTVRNNKLVADLTVPLKNLISDSFRLNIGFRDQDDLTSSDQSILWWKPKWGSRSDYPGSGMFKLTK